MSGAIWVISTSLLFLEIVIYVVGVIFLCYYITTLTCKTSVWVIVLIEVAVSTYSTQWHLVIWGATIIRYLSLSRIWVETILGGSWLRILWSLWAWTTIQWRNWWYTIYVTSRTSRILSPLLSQVIQLSWWPNPFSLSLWRLIGRFPLKLLQYLIGTVITCINIQNIAWLKGFWAFLSELIQSHIINIIESHRFVFKHSI